MSRAPIPRAERCTPGSVTPVRGDGFGDACSVIVSQPNEDVGGWVIDLFAETPHGRHWLRADVLPPPGPGVPGARVIAVEHVPGATQFSAVVSPPPEAADGANGIDVAVRCYTGCGALTLERMARAGLQYFYDSGAGAGAATVPPGARVNQLSMTAPDAAPGFMAIGTGPLITVPNGRTFSEAFADPRKQLVGPVPIGFLTAQSWFVSWVF